MRQKIYISQPTDGSQDQSGLEFTHFDLDARGNKAAGRLGILSPPLITSHLRAKLLSRHRQSPAHAGREVPH
ncbi:MAG: hypothetical protein ACUVTH_14965 [Thermogutta sp.]